VSIAGGSSAGALWLAVAGAFAGAAGPLGAAVQQSSEDSPRGVDRVVAVVDQDPLLLSDIDQVTGLGLAERREGESDAAFRQRVLEGLIEQRLRLHEVGRFGFTNISVEAIETQVRQLRAEFPSQEAFARRLEELGMTEDDLRQLLARQEAVLRYVEERLGPRVFVSLDDVQVYYDEELVPVLKQRGAAVPPLEEVQEEIRGLLKAKRLNEEIDRWTEELRRQADIEILLGDYPGDLPPVVDRIGGPAAGSSQP
jgi:parvulin-like peptidyl-prolyl isomerase